MATFPQNEERDQFPATSQVKLSWELCGNPPTKSPRSGSTFRHERENKDDSKEKKAKKEAAAVALKQQKQQQLAPVHKDLFEWEFQFVWVFVSSL